METIFGLLIILVTFISGINWLGNTAFGAERWCESCNTRNTMKLRGGSFICKQCGHPNQKDQGCPHCGWYGRFETLYVGRVGPFIQRIDPLSSVVVYKETWNCPSHANFTITVAASESKDYSSYSESATSSNLYIPAPKDTRRNDAYPQKAREIERGWLSHLGEMLNNFQTDADKEERLVNAGSYPRDEDDFEVPDRCLTIYDPAGLVENLDNHDYEYWVKAQTNT
jgi:hypothetical protein